jgi:hypothetical protein
MDARGQGGLSAKLLQGEADALADLRNLPADLSMSVTAWLGPMHEF